MGSFYPSIDEDFDESKDCPTFWQTNKIKINAVNFTDNESLSNVQAIGYVAMALNFAVVFCWIFVILRSKGFRNAFNKPPFPGSFLRSILPGKITKNTTFRKTLLTGGLIFKFLMALLDSFFGEIRQ